MPTVQTEITWERITDLLCSAFEGGSNYWYHIRSTGAPIRYDVNNEEKDGHKYSHIYYPVNPKGYLHIVVPDERTGRDSEVNGQKQWILNQYSIEKGLQVFAKEQRGHFADFVSEKDDATTADVFLQCCLFGEVIFG